MRNGRERRMGVCSDRAIPVYHGKYHVSDHLPKHEKDENGSRRRGGATDWLAAETTDCIVAGLLGGVAEERVGLCILVLRRVAIVI
jgi:hypothetical protein